MMGNTTNLVCAFIGGVTIGALATYSYMKKRGVYIGVDSASKPDFSPKPIEEQRTGEMERDTPSFQMEKKIDTHKTAYHAVTKATIEETSETYQDPSFDQHMAEREHPEEGEDEESDEDEYGVLDYDPSGIELEVTDGFGTVICELQSTRKDQLIYLVPQEYAGEIYPLEDLTYYEKDNVLCDENNTVIDDVSGIIGCALDHFGDCGSEKDMVFVRNCSMGFEYEITRIDGYFAAHIYGIKPEDLEGGGMAAIPKKTTKRRMEK